LGSPVPSLECIADRDRNPIADELAFAMLSAFTARPIIELKQRDKSKIETILAYGKH
jgi:hypothetical protein